MVVLKEHQKIQVGNITQYLILEGLGSVGKATLLADVEMSTLDEPPDVVWFWVWHFWKLQLLDKLC